MRGSEFNDIITGNGGNNTLEGQGGNDVLSGNGGNDTLTGGTGSDIFVFEVGVADGNTPPTNNDTITDFSHSDGDRIDLRAISSIHSLSDLLSRLGRKRGRTARSLLLSLHRSDFADSQKRRDGQFDGQRLHLCELVGSIRRRHRADARRLRLQHAVRRSGGQQSVPVGEQCDARLRRRRRQGHHVRDDRDRFTYDGTTHLVTGGTITEIDILNTTDPTQTTQDHVLVNTNGWTIDAATFFSDIGAYAANHTGPGLALLNGIFNSATYSIVGTAGFADNNSKPHDGADVFFGGDHADVFNGMAGPFGPGDPGNDTVDYSHAPAVNR